MNERIQQLAEQAGLFVDFNGNPWPKALSAEESIAAYNKFAELIVRECCQKLENDGMVEVAMEMKRHFGVE